MLSRVTRLKIAPASVQAWYSRTLVAAMSRGSSKGSNDQSAGAPPPIGVPDPALAWIPVTDPASTMVYWRNTITNETTCVGAPKPSGATLATSSNFAVTPAKQASTSIQQASQDNGGLSVVGWVVALVFAPFFGENNGGDGDFW